MNRKTVDWGGNIAAFLLVLSVNWMANGIPLGGRSTGEISDLYPSPFTPAGFTFAIWGIIYLSLSAFVIYQALPAQRNNLQLAGISSLFKFNCLANALWIFAWHYEYLLLSVLLMACILFSLVLIYRSLNIVGFDASWPERIALQLPFSLYTAWISVASIANISALQTDLGLDDAWLGFVPWTLLKLALAGAIAATVIQRRHDCAFALVIAWAAFGISIKQSASPTIAGGALMLCLLALLLVCFELVRRLRARRF